MLRPRKVVALFWLVSLFGVWFATAQDFVHRPSPPTDLKLVVVGTHTQEFVIIRRDALTCYLIASVSLQVAKEIEGLIGSR
jgi:hypothetical protein